MLNILLTILFLSIVDTKKQTITVKGILLCDRRPQPNLTVELKEKDRVTFDDTLATVKSDKNGSFVITGSDNEIFSIEPYMNIIHNCNVKKIGCSRITTYKFTKAEVDTVVNLDIINLNLRGHDDKENC
uniref:Transthyretin-like family protein n=1 Tax=Strongyloides venezuelensis TaxID=75913 RepID=A0A0K0F635_STRVS